MKKAFTLAEVLITLAVIGVVAALTIPALVHKYQNKQYYTQFMKVYNTIQTAWNITLLEGNSDMFCAIDSGGSNANLSEIGKRSFTQYLKVRTYCDEDIAECGMNADIKPLNTSGAQNEAVGYAQFVNLLPNMGGDGVIFNKFILDDGTFMAFGTISLVDTNGNKGPNVIGRDIFFFGMVPGDPNANYECDKKIGLILFTPISPNGIISTLQEAIADCSTSSSSTGFSCGPRLLLEGKMNY